MYFDIFTLGHSLCSGFLDRFRENPELQRYEKLGQIPTPLHFSAVPPGWRGAFHRRRFAGWRGVFHRRRFAGWRGGFLRRCFAGWRGVFHRRRFAGWRGGGSGATHLRPVGRVASATRS
ncbi:MAG: hypothetical protein IJ255_01490, partial [Bacteroidales bacterium]|nr:hypothetical protein [Bacteroidales bacterium]